LEKTTNWRDLFLKGVKDEGMTKLLESVLNQVLQAQAAEQIKAEPYERTEEREDYIVLQIVINGVNRRYC